jgi:hypothetical protein
MFQEEKKNTSIAIKILNEHGEFLNQIVEKEIKKLEDGNREYNSEFETIKKYYTILGMKDGMKLVVRKLNELANKKYD